MDRKELVSGIKNSLKAVAESLVSAMNEIRLSMNTRVAELNLIRKELIEDNEALGEIQVAVEDFAEDVAVIAGDMEEVCNVVDDVLYDLENIPCELETYSERAERISQEDSEDEDDLDEDNEDNAE